MKTWSTISTIFFCSLLIFSLYSIPNQIGQAYAHDSSSHEDCWNWAFNAIPLFIGLVTFIIIAYLVSLAFVTFGASLAGIPLVNQVSFVSKIVAIPLQWLAGSACKPMVVAPPSAVAGTSHLDCTGPSGFEFTNFENIENKDFKTTNYGTKEVIPTITEKGTSESRILPSIISIALIWPALPIFIPMIIGLVLELIFLKYSPGFSLDDSIFLTGDASRLLFRETIPVFLKFFLNEVGVGAIVTATLASPIPFYAVWKDDSLNQFPEKAIATHPWAFNELDTGVEKVSSPFKLGNNTVTYYAEKEDEIPGKDTDTYPINVYDSESPKIEFGAAKNVTLEANTHYGWKHDVRSEPLLRLGAKTVDNCTPKADLEYIGPKFFLLSSLKKDQYAPWKTQDTINPTYHSLSPLDVARALNNELDGLNANSFDETRSAQISPTQQINFTLPKEGFATSRHLLAQVANAAVHQLIEDNREAIATPPTADVIISGELKDFLTDDKISIVGVPEKEDQVIQDVNTEYSEILVDALPEGKIKELLGIKPSALTKAKNEIQSSVTYLTGSNRGEHTLFDEPFTIPNVFVDFQYVTVLDRIPPSILVTEDLALEINQTSPAETNSTLIDKSMGGCAQNSSTYSCWLKIRPPAVFDIADPFPKLFENYTDNGNFKEVEGDLIGNFSLGVSKIGWKAVDFSNNGHDKIVTQLVNLKLNGTNIPSIVYNVTDTAFSTVPKQVTLIANNTDMDPLKFLIEQNPSKGILDTPIDAKFLQKFELEGKVSKLTGITSEAGNNGIFFTDSRHERVLNIDTMENLETSFVNPQLGEPTGISLTSSGFMISDWPNNKILNTTDDGTVLETYDVTGLFEKPEYLSVDQVSNDIYVTDSENATLTKLTNFGIFNQPEGFEFDEISGNAFVVDNDNIVKVFNSEGISSGSFGNGYIDSPTDVTVDSAENIYVLDSQASAIKKFSSDYLLLDYFGNKTNEQSLFNAPQGITSQGSDLFVADTQSHKVQKISSFNPKIFEDYGVSNWITEGGNNVKVSEGMVKFKNATTGNGEPIQRVYKELGTSLDDSWSAEFEITSGVLKNDANAFVWLLTNDTLHPQNVTHQDAIGVIYDNQELKIFQRHGDVNTTSTGIPLPDGKNIEYFVSLDKLNATKTAMVVYTDTAKTTQLNNGNVTHVISNQISDLQVLQHANNIVQGGGDIDLLVDDTLINPLTNWLGKCSTGPNCNAGISYQFTCTDTTCFDSGNGTSSGQFDLPKGVSSNSTHLFVADNNNHRIQIFNINDGTHEGNLAVTYPKDVEYMNYDNRIVVISDNEFVKVFKNDNTFLEFGGFGEDPGEFKSANSLGIDTTGNIYVTDDVKDTVQKFDKDGIFIKEWKSSIDSRFGNFIEVFEFYSPGIQARALDAKNDKIIIGDWNPDHRQIITTNSHGGKLTKFSLPDSILEPHSLAFDESGKIFITDPATKTISVLDGSDGSLIDTINVDGISSYSIVPTGITSYDSFIFVFDNATEQIFSINDAGNNADLHYSAKDLFGNLNDIAFNSTHLFGLDITQNKSSIIQIRWDKGINETPIDVGSDVTGVTKGKGIESKLLFYTVTGPEDKLYSINPANGITTQIIDLSGVGVLPTGVATNPMVSGLVNVTIDDSIINEPDLIFSDPRGLAFSPDNEYLYVSNSMKNQIMVFNATTYELLEDRTISDTLISLPTALLVEPDGTLLVASTGNNKILEINFTDSSPVSVFAQAGDFISSPNGLAISPDGEQLLVSSSGSDDKIQKYGLIRMTALESQTYTEYEGGPELEYSLEYEIQNRGQYLGNLVDTDNKNSLVTPQGIVINPADGLLYVASFDSDEILKWNLDGTFMGKFGISPVEQEVPILDGPSSLLFNGSSLFVSSVNNHQVLEFDVNTGEFKGIFSDETTKNPDGLAINPDGNLLVSSRNSNDILEYGPLKIQYYISDWSDLNNQRIFGFGNNGELLLDKTLDLESPLLDPKNIASNSDGKLWIVDAGSPARLVKINPVANELIDELDISSIVEEPAPEVFFNDTADPPVYVDSFLNTYTTMPQDIATSITPRGLSLDKNDNLYITDWDNHRIVILDEIGTFLGQIRLNSTFIEPLDIAINQTGINEIPNLWVNDKNFTGNEIGNLVSLDLTKQFHKIEFADELSPLLRGLATNNTSIITTPSNSGSLFKIDSKLNAHFDSKHFIIPLGIDLTEDPFKVLNNIVPSLTGIYVSDWKEKRIVALTPDVNYDREFDFKRVGFPTQNLGDIEVDDIDEFFMITEPNRATIDLLGFDGIMDAYLSVADKYVLMSSVDSDVQDNFYVYSNDDESIAKYDIRGELIEKKDVPLDDNDTLVDLTLGPNSESLFLAVSGKTPSGKIIKFDSTSFEEQAMKVLDFKPSSIALDKPGNIYLSDSTMEITKFNDDFSDVSSFTIPSGVVGMISDIIIDSNDNLYASDKENHRVYKYDLSSGVANWLGKCDLFSNPALCDIDSLHSTGFTCTDNPLDCTNTSQPLFGRDVGQFFQPTKLALDGLNNLYVADIKISRDAALSNNDPMIDFEDVFNRGNVPRVQKFTQDGYFVNQVISDTNNTSVEGNFAWIKGLAYGANNFYVADVDKLHVFDVSPFSNISFDPTTENTTAQVIYESLIGIGMTQGNETESFLYSAFDGFDKSTNIGNVTLTVTNPDPDGDGLFGDIDLDPENISDEFASSDGTSGQIISREMQELIIREDRNPENGVYIQSNILFDLALEPGEDITKAEVNLCDDIVKIKFNPGNRLTVTCILGGLDGTENKGAYLEIIRGQVDVTFYDQDGRSSNSKILHDNSILFDMDEFEFTSEGNTDRIKQKVTFNGKNHDYFVNPTDVVRVDKAPPIFLPGTCPAQLELPAESLSGVTWTEDAQNPTDTGLTDYYDQIYNFLNFNAEDVDDGNPEETNGDDVTVSHNATETFGFDSEDNPTKTVIEFIAVDKIGNTEICYGDVLVGDFDEPTLVWDQALENPNHVAGIGLVNMTNSYSEGGRAFFELPKVLDLPENFGDEMGAVVKNTNATCSAISGSLFMLGNNTVVCSGVDDANNPVVFNRFNFTITIEPNPNGLRITDVTAIDKTGPGLTDGDGIIVDFSVPTNEPPVSTAAEIYALLDVIDETLGDNLTGEFLTPSSLLITINDAPDPAELMVGKTKFNLKNNVLLKSAGNLLNSSGTNGGDISPITLKGNFSMPSVPYITAFISNDPNLDFGNQDDLYYSVGDTFTIRFSEPTNVKTGTTFSQDNPPFEFSEDIGDEYTGIWINRSTVIITITMKQQGWDPDPILGTTRATVTGDIKNAAGTSSSSTSTSPPLSGSFREFNLIKVINENGKLVETLPSGITLGIKFHNLTAVSLAESSFNARNHMVISELVEVGVTNSTSDCLLGCEITFWIHDSELKQFGTSLSQLRILHDANEDGFIKGSESIIPDIKKHTSNLFSVSATVFSLSPIGLGAIVDSGGGGGGGGDNSPPSFENWSYLGDPSLGIGGSFIQEIKLTNEMPTAKVAVGNEAQFILKLYENSGLKALNHVSLYMNLHGLNRQFHDSDTYIRYDHGQGVKVIDPHDMISKADISIIPREGYADIIFSITFEKPMQKSDLILRAWDVYRNYADAVFFDAIEVLVLNEDEQLESGIIKAEDLPSVDEDGSETKLIPDEILSGWMGYSEDVVSDAQILELLGIEGNTIPSWFKNNVGKWLYEKQIGEKEFIEALKNMGKKSILFS